MLRSQIWCVFSLPSSWSRSRSYPPCHVGVPDLALVRLQRGHGSGEKHRREDGTGDKDYETARKAEQRVAEQDLQRGMIPSAGSQERVDGMREQGVDRGAQRPRHLVRAAHYLN